MLTVLNMILLGLLLVTAVAVVLIRDLLVATILLSGQGLFMAILWTRLGAPDLALAYVAIMIFTVTTLLVISVHRTSRREDER